MQNLPIYSRHSAEACRVRREIRPQRLLHPSESMTSMGSRTGQEALRSNTARSSALLDPATDSAHFHIENWHNTIWSIRPSGNGTVLVTRQTFTVKEGNYICPTLNATVINTTNTYIGKLFPSAGSTALFEHWLGLTTPELTIHFFQRKTHERHMAESGREVSSPNCLQFCQSFEEGDARVASQIA